MGLFRGFVPTKNKKCTMKFKNVGPNDLLTYDEVKSLKEYAGILDKETVLIDVDDSKQANALMDIIEEKQVDCRVYETTRGMHFLFKNNGKFDRCRTKINLACGIVADIKVGLKNSYEVLKYDGKEREIIWDCNDESQIGVPPYYLTPIPTKTDFQNLGEGDGRNNALFSYIIPLSSAGLSMQECRETIKLLNKHVLPSPLDDQELEVVLRDEAFKQKDTFFL